MDSKKTTLIETFFENKLPCVQGSYMSGKREGVWKAWQWDEKLPEEKRHTLAVEEIYLNGELHGERTEYYPSGQVEVSETWSRGYRIGMRRTWYPNGNLATQEFYEKGRHVGEKKLFYSLEDPVTKKDRMWILENYSEGQLYGYRSEWWKNGKLLVLEKYLSGQLLESKTWNRKGEVTGLTSPDDKCAIFVQPPPMLNKPTVSVKPEGLVEKHWTNGQLKVQEFWKNGVLEGERKEWYCDNAETQSVQEFYKNGFLEGERKEWHPNGQPRLRDFYTGGKIQGIRRRWHDNGQLSVQEYYTAGEPNGERSEWTPVGRLSSKTYWKKGVLSTNTDYLL